MNTKQAKLTDEERKERRRESDRKYREANKEKIKAYRQANREKIAAQSRKWREVNKEKIKAYREDNKERTKAYFQDNKETIAATKKAWREENKEKLSEYFKDYRSKNKEKIAANKRRYKKQRKQNDRAFKLRESLRNRLALCLCGKFKAGSAVSDMGCTGQEACDHLESLFDEHMTWENWGTYWQVDHIYPLNKANLEDRIEFLAVNNWRNLQPLEKGENKRKDDTVSPYAQKLFDELKKGFSL